jgi:hypothetical protein
MLDALLKVWPILAGIGGVATAVLVYLGAAVWKVARWTADHDLRVVTLTDSVTRIDQRVQVLEQRSLTQDSAIIRLEAKQ